MPHPRNTRIWILSSAAVLGAAAVAVSVWPASAQSVSQPVALQPSAPGPVVVTTPAAPATTGSTGSTASTGTPQAATSAGTLLWTPAISRGAAAFSSVQCASNQFSTTTDSVKGRVWAARQPAGQERCEVVGPTVTSGSSYYLGWSSKIDITDASDRYIFQLKCDPSTGTANHPIELDATNGRVRLQEWTTDHVAVPLWSAPISNNQWHSYALRISEGRTKGTIQLWYDGAPQKFSTGSYTYTGTTYDGTVDYLKWGVYHPATGTAENWFTSPRMATTLALATAGS